jgi:predicted Mrr-cat superfamily restriction endonuclease
MLCQNFKLQTNPSSLIVEHPTFSSMSTNAPLHTTMQDNEIGLDDLVKSLVDNFNVLADEVQLLSDRKTILEHKLRFAHEQVRYKASLLHHVLLET